MLHQLMHWLGFADTYYSAETLNEQFVILERCCDCSQAKIDHVRTAAYLKEWQENCDLYDESIRK